MISGDIFKSNSSYEIASISVETTLKFILNGPIKYDKSLVLTMVGLILEVLK